MIGPVGVGVTLEEAVAVADAVPDVANIAEPMEIGRAEQPEVNEALYQSRLP